MDKRTPSEYVAAQAESAGYGHQSFRTAWLNVAAHLVVPVADARELVDGYLGRRWGEGDAGV